MTTPDAMVPWYAIINVFYSIVDYDLRSCTDGRHRLEPSCDLNIRLIEKFLQIGGLDCNITFSAIRCHSII